MDSKAGSQRFLLGVWIAMGVLTPIIGWAGSRGFAPAVAFMGLLCLWQAKPSDKDCIGLGLLAAIAIWAGVTGLWSPASPAPLQGLALANLEQLERFTAVHMALEVVVAGGFVLAAAQMQERTAERALDWLGYGLMTLAAILVVEGVTHARLYLAIKIWLREPVRPDIAVRNVAVAGYAVATLLWPVAVSLWRQNKRAWVGALALAVVFSTFFLRGDSPSIALAISALVFFAVYRLGRPAVLGMAVLAAVYFLATPWLMIAMKKAGLFAAMSEHLPLSWVARLNIWGFTTNGITQAPWAGWGMDASRSFPGFIPLHPHNGAVQIWFELGLVGAALAAAFWAFLFWRISEDANKQRLFAATACATATVFLVIGAISFSLWQEWWIALGAFAMAACVALKRFVSQPFVQSRVAWTPWPADRTVLAIITALVLARLATSAAMGLGMDESYSTAISRDLHLSYFDHPPLHQWIAHLGGEILGYGRWTRTPFIALFAGSTWLMYRLTARLFGEQAGVWAVIALNLSAFFTLAVGQWVLPDGPLVFCELAAAATLARLFFPKPGEGQQPWLLWPLAGLWLGLAALSKYQAAPVALGLALFVLGLPAGRRWLKHPAPYVGAVVALIVASPVVVWNAQHDWASFAFQSGRGAPHRFNPMGPLESLAGQIALLLPWVAVPLIWAGVGAVRQGRKDPRGWFCLMAAAPTILLFALLPLLGNRGLPHWPMPGWLLLFPVLGDRLARRASEGRRWPVRWATISAGVLAVLWGAAASDAATSWMRDAFPKVFPKTSPTYEAIEWKRLRTDLDRRGVLKAGMFVVAAEWNEAGKIDQAVGDKALVLVFSQDPRQYAMRTDNRNLMGHDALIIGRGPTVAQELQDLRPHFASLTPLPGFSVGRGGRAEIPLTVILAKDLVIPYPVPAWAKR